jgi:RNA polymerase sigma-70 factor (sigma-E family)
MIPPPEIHDPRATLQGVQQVTLGMIASSTTAQAVLGPGGGRMAADKPDFDDFVAARSTALLRTAYLLTHDHALAEDLLQTALTKSWFAWGRISGSPEAYVRKVLVNTFASSWRRRWNGELATAELPERGTDDTADAITTEQDLWAAMGRLPRRQRAVVVLRYFEDLTEVQTADALGCSVGTVKSQASKALAKLRIDPGLAEHHAGAETGGES